MKNCKDAVTPTEAQELADHRAYLMRVFLRLKVVGYPFPDPGSHLSGIENYMEVLMQQYTYIIAEILAIYESVDKEVFNADLDVYNRTFYSYEYALMEFGLELLRRGSTKKVQNPAPEQYAVYFNGWH